MRKLTSSNDPAEMGRITLDEAAMLLEDRRRRFAPQDVLFARAGAVHRFGEFSEDLLVWVFFYGPEGGEPDPAR